MKTIKTYYNPLEKPSQLVSDVYKLMKGIGELPLPLDKPALVLISGFPGVGKSFFCLRLAERLPAVVLESDALRTIFFEQPEYSQAESAWLF